MLACQTVNSEICSIEKFVQERVTNFVPTDILGGDEDDKGPGRIAGATLRASCPATTPAKIEGGGRKHERIR